MTFPESFSTLIWACPTTPLGRGLPITSFTTSIDEFLDPLLLGDLEAAPLWIGDLFLLVSFLAALDGDLDLDLDLLLSDFPLLLRPLLGLLLLALLLALLPLSDFFLPPNPVDPSLSPFDFGVLMALALFSTSGSWEYVHWSL